MAEESSFFNRPVTTGLRPPRRLKLPMLPAASGPITLRSGPEFRGQFHCQSRFFNRYQKTPADDVSHLGSPNCRMVRAQGHPAWPTAIPASRRRVLRPSPAVGLLEILESRELLTALVGVTVNGNSIRLNELRGGSTSTQEGFTVSYTSSQVVLTGTNGTEFRVNGQVMSTDTININGPATLKVHLNQHANDVTISGDGTDSLSSLTLRMGGAANTIPSR